MAKSSAVKLSITIKEDLLERADSYAVDNGLTRSALIGMALKQYLDAVDAMPSVNKMLSAMAAVVDGTFKGEMSPSEAQSRIDSISQAYKSITGKEID